MLVAQAAGQHVFQPPGLQLTAVEHAGDELIGVAARACVGARAPCQRNPLTSPCEQRLYLFSNDAEGGLLVL